jgi:hypothetical protein
VLNSCGDLCRNHVVGLERIESLADRQFQDREGGVGALGKGLAEPNQGVRQLFQRCQGVAQHGAEIYTAGRLVERPEGFYIISVQFKQLVDQSLGEFRQLISPSDPRRGIKPAGRAGRLPDVL